MQDDAQDVREEKLLEACWGYEESSEKDQKMGTAY
jgi:hypothetical protein